MPSVPPEHMPATSSAGTPLLLHAGPLAVYYEHGALRYIRLGEREVVRMIYVAVRDRNWGTIPAVRHSETITRHTDSFQINYTAEHRQGPIDFVWRASISGSPDGTIEFAMDGEARSTFLRNRIGFCILHPIAECAGQPCVVETTDGAHVEGMFPRWIAPHQPFLNMRAITHEVAPGLRAEVRMLGDTFEMEDQRNWTDASYKTYSTPLALPFPVEVAAGTRIAQSVTLTLHGQPPQPVAATEATARPQLELTDSFVPLPPLGLGAASHGMPLAPGEISLLRALQPAHLRVDLRLPDDGFEARLAQAAEQARALGCALEVALFLGDAAQAELERLAVVIEANAPPIARWLVFHVNEKSTSARWLELVRAKLARFGAPIGGGSNAYFTQINREHPPLAACDLVSYSINPQVHAFDDATLIECLAAQADTLASARQFCGELPLVVSPVTLRPRFNPDATGPEPPPAPGELPPQVDPRQAGMFCAAWTAGSLKYLAAAGAASVTFFETTGWRGVIEAARGSPLPERFPSKPGKPFPVYYLFADVAGFAGGRIAPLTASQPLHADGFVLAEGARRRGIIANTSGRVAHVVVRGLPPEVRVRLLDEQSAQRAAGDPLAFVAERGEPRGAEAGSLWLELGPYAVARIDWEADPVV